MSRRKRFNRTNGSISPQPETSFIAKMKNQMQGFIERIGEDIESSDDISNSKTQSMLRLYSKLSRDYVFLHDRHQDEIEEKEKKTEAQKKKEYKEQADSMIIEGQRLHNILKEIKKQEKEGFLNQPLIEENPKFNGLLMPDS